MENNGRLNIINSPDSTNSKSTINSNLPSKSNSNSNSTNSIPIHKTIKKIHHTSKIGYDIDRTKKHNQDSYFVGNNFTNDLNSVFMTVCDGHGIFGHEVSRFLKKTLPLILSNELKHRIKLGDRDTNKIKQIIEKVFISVNYLLMNDNTIDTNFSGSTCISVLFSPEKLICANVGDSRAVLGRLVNSSKIYRRLINKKDGLV
jgi:serine/threonine protein phosphatase PrpC